MMARASVVLRPEVEVHRTLGDFGLRKDVVEAHLGVGLPRELM